jgi:hypothetical protein
LRQKIGNPLHAQHTHNSENNSCDNRQLRLDGDKPRRTLWIRSYVASDSIRKDADWRNASDLVRANSRQKPCEGGKISRFNSTALHVAHAYILTGNKYRKDRCIQPVAGVNAI